jgi:Protein of unknown function, DUF481
VISSRTLVLTLTLLSVISLDALARSKTDVVTLYNGDRITGEIKSLDNGILNYSTDAMGTLKIEWQEIATLQSDFYYEIRLSSGTRYFGSIVPSEQPGQLIVVDLDGDHPLDWLQVVGARPIEKKFIDRIDLYLAAGYSYDRGSAVAQTTINTTISYENEKARNTLSGRTSQTDSDGEDTSSTKVDVDRAIWTRHQKWFRAFTANYEANDELGLKHRIGIGSGMGRLILDSQKHRLVGVAGLQVITEKSKAGDQDQNLELYLSSRYRAWRFNTPELDLDFGFTLYPSLTDSGRVRSASDLRLRWELIADLFFDITSYATWDSESESNSGIDYGVSTGLGWEF